ncbi:sodium:proton symporter [Acuticoccus kandeliae]|uniref:sodium:proton symporter n=1 Tax=Acuticoccus kandeliae TaxID=2073160 RepID=UPI000D3E26DE|nr:sodium:proton symporter [Acuticoccus kandeliae]
MGIFPFISRNGTWIIALSIGVGIVFPGFAGTLRPYLGYCVMTMLCVSLLRVDIAAFFMRLKRPVPVVAAAVWISVIFPLATLSLAALAGPPYDSPIVLTVLFLFAVPSPIVSAPAFAMLMGLDGALVLAVMLMGTVTLPVTAPIIAAIFVPNELPISVLDLAGRLALLLTVASIVATVLRRLLGARRIVEAKSLFDTISVGVAVIFALGAMAGVSDHFLVAPGETIAIGVAVLGFALMQIALAYLIFRPFVGTDAVAIAYAAGNRNSGLIVAALGTMQINDTVWLYFALGQLPCFLFPLMLKPLGRRLSGAPREVTA